MAREWESKVAEKAGTKEGFMDRTEGRRLVLPARSLGGRSLEVSHYQVITHNLRYNDIHLMIAKTRHYISSPSWNRQRATDDSFRPKYLLHTVPSVSRDLPGDASGWFQSFESTYLTTVSPCRVRGCDSPRWLLVSLVARDGFDHSITT